MCSIIQVNYIYKLVNNYTILYTFYNQINLMFNDFLEIDRMIHRIYLL